MTIATHPPADPTGLTPHGEPWIPWRETVIRNGRLCSPKPGVVLLSRRCIEGGCYHVVEFLDGNPGNCREDNLTWSPITLAIVSLSDVAATGPTEIALSVQP